MWYCHVLVFHQLFVEAAWPANEKYWSLIDRRQWHMHSWYVLYMYMKWMVSDLGVNQRKPGEWLCKDTVRHARTHTHTHTQPFNGPWSRTTRVGQYQKKHSPTHTHPDHRTSFIIFLHLQRSVASSLFILRAWQSFRTTSLQVLFGLPFGLGPSTSYSIHIFTQSSSSPRRTCPYQRSLFCCNTNAMLSTPTPTDTVRPNS